MTLKARAKLARTTYEKALADARRECTPARWRRLLRASWNLKDALTAAGLGTTGSSGPTRGAPAPRGLAP